MCASRSFVLAVVPVVMLGSSCAKKEEPAPSGTSDVADPSGQARRTTTAPPRRTVRRTPEAMRDHFTSGVLIRDALIAGDLALAKWNATWLAEHEPDPGIESWSPLMTDLRARARKIVEAPDLATAAAATAGLALECGRCHKANGASPRFVESDPRVAASGPRPHMLEHQWAAERMWEGLIGANETTWNTGVAGLAVAPLGQDEIFANATATQRIAALAAEVHSLGADGGKVQTWSERATVYGHLLATCATCHAETISR